MRNVTCKLLIGIFALGVASAANAQSRNAGEVLAVTGIATQVRPGEAATPLKPGLSVAPGATLATGAGGSVRMRMRDNSYIALAPDSGFHIEQFKLPRAGKTKDPGFAVFALLRGGFRSITGLIGKYKQDTYQIKTPVATMGVRGTEYSAFLCQDCAAPNTEDGLYVEVHSGVVIVANSYGSLSLSSGQFGYVASAAGSAPISIRRPVVFEVMGGIFAPEANISGGASGSAGRDGVDVQPEPPRIEPPASPSSP